MDITKKFIDDFHSVNKLRVWSLVITIFGDCATLRGGTIAMTELQAITSLLKIEPGALRTAMSRLTKENWLIRNKVGRNSFYKLSEQGLKSFVEPTSRIYARYQEKSDKQFYLGIKIQCTGHTESLNLSCSMNTLNRCTTVYRSTGTEK